MSEMVAEKIEEMEESINIYEERAELWKRDDIEAVKSIFSSYEDVLKDHPEYLEVAKARLMQNNAEQTKEYIKNELCAAKSAEELSETYLNLKQVIDICALDAKAYIVLPMKARVLLLVKEGDAPLKIADAAYSADAELICEETAKALAEKCVAASESLTALNEIYFALCEKPYICEDYLKEIIPEKAREILIRETESLAEAKEKLNKAQSIYDEFKANCKDKECVRITLAAESLIREYKVAERIERFPNEYRALAGIKRRQLDAKSYGEVAEYIVELSQIDVSADEGLKKDAERCYAEVGARFFTLVRNNCPIDYASLKDFIEKSLAAIKVLEAAGVYDGILKKRSFEKELVPDSMSRAIVFLNELMAELSEQNKLKDALRVFDMKASELEPEETRVAMALDKLGKIAFGNWCEVHPKLSAKAYKKAKKKLARKEDHKLSGGVAAVYKECAGIPQKEAKRKKRQKRARWVLFFLFLAAAATIAAGCIYYFNFIK